MLEKVLEKLLWSGHSSFIYEGEPLIYFDPFALHRLRRADIILVGHDHPRHCSPADIDKVRRAPTVILADEHSARHIAPPVISMTPGQQETIGNVLIEAVPAYNLHTSFHQQRKAYLGFIVTLEGLRLYHAGDTDFIPEMHDLKVDIALLDFRLHRHERRRGGPGGSGFARSCSHPHALRHRLWHSGGRPAFQGAVRRQGKGRDLV